MNMNTNTPHKTNNGGPAFPMAFNPHSNTEQHDHGMSLRDWFAGQALTGLIFHDGYGHVYTEDIANDAYSYADAMLEARNKEVAP